MTTATPAKKKLYSNLLHKLNDGKTLSANERNQLDELSELFDPTPKQTEHQPLCLTNTQLAKLYKVTPQSVCNWAKAGMPKASHGRYDLFMVMEWWMENINSDPADATTSDARGRYWNAKAEQAEIAVAKEKAELIPANAVIDEWCRRIAAVKQSLLALEIRLPPILEGKAAREMRPLVRAEAVRILEGYCRPGKYCEEPKAKPARKPAKKKKPTKKAKKK